MNIRQRKGSYRPQRFVAAPFCVYKTLGHNVQKWKGKCMESMRDVNRVMEREIKKGSSPLKLDHIEFGDYSYQEIMSQEKLFEVLTYLLRIGDFKQYAGKTILNNIYMDLRWKSQYLRELRPLWKEIIYLRPLEGI